MASSRDRKPVPRRPPGSLGGATGGIMSDWLSTLQEGDLDHTVIEALSSWLDFLENGGPPPDPVPVSAGDVHIEQALRSTLRNAFRESRNNADGRVHDLRRTVRELVGIVTTQSRRITSVRNAVHRILHSIEDAEGDAEIIRAAASDVRRLLRELDTEAQQARTAVNERLHEMRTMILGRWVEAGEIVSSAAELEMRFRGLCAAAGLFGESVAIVSIAAASPEHARSVATALRGRFRRETDVIARLHEEASVMVIDTPDRHVERIASEAGAELDAETARSCRVRYCFSAEQFESVAAALSASSDAPLLSMIESRGNAA